MANEKYIDGLRTLAVWTAGSPGAYKPIACLTDSAHSLTMTMIERVNVCTGGKTEQAPKSITESFTINGVIIDTTVAGGTTAQASASELKELARAQVANGTVNTFKASDGTSGYIYFDAVLSEVSDNFTAGEDATFSASLAINGTPSAVDPNA